MKKKSDQPDRERKWYERPLWIVWFFLLIVSLQSAVASYQEYEPRAGILFAGIFVALLLGGAIVWIIKQNQLL